MPINHTVFLTIYITVNNIKKINQLKSEYPFSSSKLWDDVNAMVFLGDRQQIGVSSTTQSFLFLLDLLAVYISSMVQAYHYSNS